MTVHMKNIKGLYFTLPLSAQEDMNNCLEKKPFEEQQCPSASSVGQQYLQILYIAIHKANYEHNQFNFLNICDGTIRHMAVTWS